MSALISLIWAALVFGYLFTDERGPAYWFALSACVFFTGVNILVAEIRKAGRK